MNTVQHYNTDHHHTVQWQVSGEGSGGGGGEVVKIIIIIIIINNDIYNMHKSLQVRQSHVCHIYNI